MRYQRLADWLAWQETLHPRAIDPGLERVTEVARRMALDQPRVPVITVAGTNGKGTVVACLEALLQRAGLRVGCYTSPHVLRYNERVRMGAEDASDALIIAAFDAIDRARGEISLSYFEFGTLAALWCFRESGCDAWVLEVGLGGRLDAVNLLDADVAVITSIDIDHTEWLGADREAIAAEKAGIMRARQPVVCGERDRPASLAERANALAAELIVPGWDYDHTGSADGRYWDYTDNHGRLAGLPAPHGGAAAVTNAALALAAYRQLRGVGELGQADIASALARVRVPARRYPCPGQEYWLIDVAHNPAAARALARHLRDAGGAGRYDAVFAVLKRKDLAGVLAPLIPVIRHWHILELGDDDARPLDEVVSVLGDLGGEIGMIGPPAELLTRVDEHILENGQQVVAFGSFRVAEVVLRWAGVAEGALAAPAGGSAWRRDTSSA